MRTIASFHAKDRKSQWLGAIVCLALAPLVLFLGLTVKMELSLALVFDAIVFVCCVALLWRHARLSAMHPATTYLFFHVYTVTLRLIALALGAQTLPVFRGAITLSEIARASAVADVALICMTLAWIRTSRRDLQKNGPMPRSDAVLPSDLSKRYVGLVAVPTFIIGIFGLINYGYSVEAPSIDLGVWTNSNYLSTTVTWSYQALLMLIYVYGFRLRLLLPALFFLALMIFNADRFVLVVSVIFMCFVFLSRRRKTWFPPWMLAILFFVAVVWVPLKIIASDIRLGESASTVVSNAIDYYDTAITQQSGGGDTQFLDMGASVMTLVDEYGRYFYGRAWLPVLTVPVPRQLWPDKPKISDYLWEISTPDRPMAQIGLVPLLFGDAYVNFGYLGVIIVPFIVAYVYGWGYFKAFRRSHYSLTRFTYLVFACNLIQVYRDGVMSIILFAAVAMMPMMFVIILHLLARVHIFRIGKRRTSISDMRGPYSPAREP